MVQVVVLLGAPGSGKSTVGGALGAEGFRWREWEPAILARWGTRDRFLAAKREALPALHAEILDWVGSSPVAAVVESTGLSDAPLVQHLVGSGEAVVVRLDVGEATAAARVAGRAAGRHLSDDADANRRTWRAVYELAAPKVAADLVLDTEALTVDEAVRAIVDRVRVEGRASDD